MVWVCNYEITMVGIAMISKTLMCERYYVGTHVVRTMKLKGMLCTYSYDNPMSSSVRVLEVEEHFMMHVTCATSCFVRVCVRMCGCI